MLKMRILIKTAILFYCSIEDIKYRHVNIIVLILGAFLISTDAYINNDSGGSLYIIAGLLPGALLLAASKLGMGIGEGDGYLCLFACMLETYEDVINILFVSFVLSSLYASYLKITSQTKEDSSVPFAPFVMSGVIICEAAEFIKQQVLL